MAAAKSARMLANLNAAASRSMRSVSAACSAAGGGRGLRKRLGAPDVFASMPVVYLIAAP